MKPYYTDEVKKAAESLEQYKNCFKFAAVADSHLDNSISDTIENIKAVDDNALFNCIIHLGDFLNGSIPRKYTNQILKEQMELFKGAVKTKCLYPV